MFKVSLFIKNKCKLNEFLKIDSGYMYKGLKLGDVVSTVSYASLNAGGDCFYDALLLKLFTKTQTKLKTTCTEFVELNKFRATFLQSAEVLLK